MEHTSTNCVNIFSLPDDLLSYIIFLLCEKGPLATRLQLFSRLRLTHSNFQRLINNSSILWSGVDVALLLDTTQLLQLTNVFKPGLPADKYQMDHLRLRPIFRCDFSTNIFLNHAFHFATCCSNSNILAGFPHIIDCCSHLNQIVCNERTFLRLQKVKTKNSAFIELGLFLLGESSYSIYPIPLPDNRCFSPLSLGYPVFRLGLRGNLLELCRVLCTQDNEVFLQDLHHLVLHITVSDYDECLNTDLRFIPLLAVQYLQIEIDTRTSEGVSAMQAETWPFLVSVFRTCPNVVTLSTLGYSFPLILRSLAKAVTIERAVMKYKCVWVFPSLTRTEESETRCYLQESSPKDTEAFNIIFKGSERLLYTDLQRYRFLINWPRTFLYPMGLEIIDLEKLCVQLNRTDNGMITKNLYPGIVAQYLGDVGYLPRIMHLCLHVCIFKCFSDALVDAIKESRAEKNVSIVSYEVNSVTSWEYDDDSPGDNGYISLVEEAHRILSRAFPNATIYCTGGLSCLAFFRKKLQSKLLNNDF